MLTFVIFSKKIYVENLFCKCILHFMKDSEMSRLTVLIFEKNLIPLEILHIKNMRLHHFLSLSVFHIRLNEVSIMLFH